MPLSLGYAIGPEAASVLAYRPITDDNEVRVRA